jgi:hypothetical protein
MGPRRVSGVLPRVDKEAVYDEQCGQQKCLREQNEPGPEVAGDGWDKRGSGEKDADGQFLWHAITGNLAASTLDVDQDEIAKDSSAENDVEMQRVWRELGYQQRQSQRCRRNGPAETPAMAMMEKVALLDIGDLICAWLSGIV